jgi:hypothetical protein
MIADTIARIKITLDNVKPAVLRRLEVPLDIRLDRLHLTIQAAMGWTNSHLYVLLAGGVGWSTPDPDLDRTPNFLDARKARLGDILEDIGVRLRAAPPCMAAAFPEACDLKASFKVDRCELRFLAVSSGGGDGRPTRRCGS